MMEKYSYIKKYNACKYKGFSTVITPLTYPKTELLVKNGFTYSVNFVDNCFFC